MVLRYLIIQMAETSASGLGGDTESEPRSSCRALDLDLENLPFEHQAPIALCDDHILIRPLQDPQLNRSSSRIARIQTAVACAGLGRLCSPGMRIRQVGLRFTPRGRGY